MATYTVIADSEIDPESPGTTTLFNKLRDNPLAQFEKASGAPVLANDYIVTAMIKDGEVTVGKLESAIAGNYLEGHFAYQTAAEIGDPTGSYTEVLKLKAARKGTYTVRMGMAESAASYNINAKLYVNGIAQGTERNPSTSVANDWFWYNENLTVNAGDLVQMYMRRTAVGAEAAGCLALLCDNPIAASTDYTDIHALNTVNGAPIV